MKNILIGTIAAISGFTRNNVFFAADTGGASTSAPEAEAPPFILNPTPPITETVEIELKKLVIDAGTQPRVAIDDEVVKEYTEIIKTAIKDEQPNPFDALSDDKLPQVFRDATGRCVLADGFHRFASHKAAHAKEMRVAIRNGSERDALFFSLGTNQEHGVRRSNKDKQRAVKIAVNDPDLKTLANTDIARLCGVSEFMVRELRPAKNTASTRTVTIRGKKTTMKTGAIGKGKGGGAKGAKAAKKGGKGKAAAKGATTSAAQDDAKEIDRLLMKVVDAVGAPEGGKFRAAFYDGSLPLTARDVRDLGGMDPKKIKAVLPLVTGPMRMKPAKAFDFIGSVLSDKIQTELHNRVIGTADGTYTFDGEGFKVVVTLTKKK